jgi:hypothetical protein
MNTTKRIGLNELMLPVWTDGTPYYRMADFPHPDNDATLTAMTDLAERLNEAVIRVQLANVEGDPILSAWLPGARAALTQAWCWLPTHRAECGGEK